MAEAAHRAGATYSTPRRPSRRVDDEARFEELLLVIDDLAERNVEVPIVVEGRRDVESLRQLGCNGVIVALHTGENLFALAERLASEAREVILLTDWDRKGAALHDQLAANLGANGVRIDASFRDDLRRFQSPPVKDVESLATYVERNLQRYHRRALGER